MSTASNSRLSSRYFKNRHDLDLMLDLLIKARSQSDDWRYMHIGEMLWNFFMVQCHLDPTQFIRLWFDGPELVGYAILGEDPLFDFQVLPAYEWQGIEEDAMAWAESLLTTLRYQDAQRWGGHLVSGSRQDNPQRRAFLEKHGFIGGGKFSEVNMIRSLDGAIEALTLPEGFRLGSMDMETDVAERAAVQHDVWQPWSVGEVSREDYLRFMQLPYYQPDLDIVAITPQGTMVSYVNGWNDPLNKIGDLGPVGAREAYRHKGLTRAVLSECMRRMQTQGMEKVCVSTTHTNEPAIRLYESVGFRIVNRYIEYTREPG